MSHRPVMNNQAVRFNKQTQSSLPTAPPPPVQPITRGTVLSAYSYAAYLFDNYEFHKAIECYKRLITQDQTLINCAYLWFNIGVIRDHLGEHHRATKAYTKALEVDDTLTIAYFCLGNATFLQQNYRRALEIYNDCQQVFSRIGEEIHDYSAEGLPWKLDKANVVFNILNAKFKMGQRQNSSPPEPHWGVNRLPGGLIFGVCSNLIRRSAELENRPLGSDMVMSERLKLESKVSVVPQMHGSSLGHQPPPLRDPLNNNGSLPTNNTYHQAAPLETTAYVESLPTGPKTAHSYPAILQDTRPQQKGRAQRLELDSMQIFDYGRHGGAVPTPQNNRPGNQTAEEQRR